MWSQRYGQCWYDNIMSGKEHWWGRDQWVWIVVGGSAATEKKAKMGEVK